MKPEITTEGDVTTFEWDVGVARVRCEVDRVRQEKNDWHCEMAWTNLSDEDRPLLLAPKTVNLSSAVNCKTVVKTLEDRSKAEIPWSEMMEQICQQIVDTAKKGPPVEKIGGAGKIPRPQYRVEKILEEKQLTWLYGFGESGKSLLADALCLTVAGGGMMLGLVGDPGEVMYLDWETDSSTHLGRIRRMAVGAGLMECPEIHYRSMAVPLVTDARNIKRYIIANNIELVIVDSVEMACGSKQYDHSPLLPMVAALRDWNVTVACIDHLSKEDQRSSGDKRTPYGDVRKWNIARAAWEVRAVSDPGADELRMAVYHRKANNGRHHPTLGYSVFFDDDTIRFQSQGIMDVGELAAGQSNMDRVEAILLRGAHRLDEVAAFTGMTEAVARTTLWRGVQKGRFKHNRDGSYGIMREGEDSA